MNVLVVNQYAANEVFSAGAGERHYYIAKQLLKFSLSYEIVSSNGNHLLKQKPIIRFLNIYSRQVFNEDLVFTWVKGSRVNLNSGFARVTSWIRFCVSLFFIRLNKKPDVVVLSSMSILPIIYCSFLKRKYKCKLILEIRDIWPLTLHEIGGISKKHLVYRFLRKLEIFAHQRADHVVSVLPNYIEYLSMNFPNQVDNFTWIPNGIELTASSHSLNSNPSKGREKVIGYFGSLGIANNMMVFLEAVKQLELVRKDFKVLIVGSGALRNDLIAFVHENKMMNVTFMNKVSNHRIPQLLQEVTICYHGCAAHNLYQYGISPNKLSEYMASGKPILSASGLAHDPVNIAGSGLVVPPSSDDIRDGLSYLLDLSHKELNNMGVRGLDYVRNSLSYAVLARKYLDVFNRLTNNK